MLYFSKPNSKLKKLQSKLKKKVYSFDLLSGWSCPNADKCMSRAVPTNDGLRIRDGANTQFRCFSASQEALFKHVYNRRSSNFKLVQNLIKNKRQFVSTFCSSIPEDAEVIRYHVAGDFFCRRYFSAAIDIANARNDLIFYAYTKDIKWLAISRNNIPANLRFTASIGGKQDKFLENWMITARVINKTYEQYIWGLPIDEDDSHAYHNNVDFLLLIHGVQPNDQRI